MNYACSMTSYLFGDRKKRKAWPRYAQEEYVELANPSQSVERKLKSETIPRVT